MGPSSVRWAQDEVAYELAEELARRAVVQEAPEELPLFWATRVPRNARGRTARPEP